MEQATAQASIAAVPAAKSYWDPERDRPRGINLVRLEVVNRKTAGLQMPRGHVLQPGVSTVDVYADEVENVKAQVEPRPDAVVQAHESFRRAIADEAKARVSGFAGDAEGFLALVDAKDPVAVAEYEFIRAQSPLSPEAMFRQTMRRDPLPLASCKLVDPNVAEPKREAVKLIESENSKGRGELGAAIAEGVNEALKPLLATIGELIKQNQNRKQ